MACEKWRVEFGVDELVRSFEYAEKARVFEYYPQYYHKTDRDGRPVYFEQCGKIDLGQMYKITSEDRMLRNLVVECEGLAHSRLPACSRMAGRLVETCCTVMDLAGVGLTSVTQVYGFVKKVMAISQNYYPERLGKLYIINAPWGFSSAFKLIKGCLDPVTVRLSLPESRGCERFERLTQAGLQVEKISVLGSSYKAELLAQIPAENLPKEFGGSCQCAAQGGCRLADQGPWNDPAFAAPVATAAPPFSDPEKAPDMATTVTTVATAVA